MISTPIDEKAESAWHRTRFYLARLRDWPANGNSPYSPVFCVSLLLAVALIIEAGR